MHRTILSESMNPFFTEGISTERYECDNARNEITLMTMMMNEILIPGEKLNKVEWKIILDDLNVPDMGD